MADGTCIGEVVVDASLSRYPHVLEVTLRLVSLALRQQRWREQTEFAVGLERHRSARALHDRIQQPLYAVQLALKQVRVDLAAPSAADMPSQSAHDLTALIERLDGVERRVVRVADEVRDIARGIPPARLQQAGLRAAIELFVQESMPIPVNVCVPPTRFAQVIEETAYAVALESLNNIAKHASASAADVTVGYSGGRLRLTVGDDGVGGAVRRVGGGLADVEARVQSLSGRLVINNRRFGVEVLMEVPCVSR
jgi:signal transduction histidine kinase